MLKHHCTTWNSRFPYSHLSIRGAVLQIMVDFASNLMQKRRTFYCLVQQPPSALTVNNCMCLLGVSTVFWVVSHVCANRKVNLSPKLVGFQKAVPRRSKAWNIFSEIKLWPPRTTTFVKKLIFYKRDSYCYFFNETTTKGTGLGNQRRETPCGVI